MSQVDDNITFFESNVVSVDTDIEVVEQRLADNITVLLSKEQIVVELINLFKKNKNIQEKIDTFLSFLFPPVNIHTYNPLSPVVAFRNFDFEITADVESEDNHAYQSFPGFLENLSNILKSKENYSKTEEKLDKLFTPFVSFTKLPNEEALYNVDALRLLDGQFDTTCRIVKDDVLFFHGYLNRVNHRQNINVFNYKQYLEDLKSLKIGDKLGKYSITEKTESHFILSSKGIEYDYINPKNNDNYLYGASYKGLKYDKTLLNTTNILFIEFPDQNTAYSFILPKNPTELYDILKQDLNAYNFQDINNILIPYNVSVNDLCKIDSFIRPSEIKYINIKNPKFKNKTVYIDKFTKNIPNDIFNFDQNDYVDNDYYRYIRLNNSKQKYYYIHQLLSEYIKEFHQTYNKKQGQILSSAVKKPLKNTALVQDKCNEQKKYKVVKHYNSYSSLLTDNDVDIYYTTNANLVLPNDLAILASSIGDIVYIRTEDKKWIKKATLPFKWCNEEYLSYQDINSGENSLCVFDYYSNVCKSIHNFKIAQYENKQKKHLELINTASLFFDKYKNIVKYGEYIINNYKHLNGINLFHSKIVTKYQAKKDDIDDDDLKDDFKFTYEDQQNYEIFIQQVANQIINKEKEEDPLDRFINNILDFINIQNFDRKDFVSKVINETKPNFSYIKKKLDDFEKNTLAELAKKGKDNKIKESNKPEYMKKVMQKIREKQEEQRVTLMNTMYFEAAKNIILRLAIKLISDYPKHIVGNIYPDCVKYLGYSVLKSDTRNIISYLSCLIKATYSGGGAVYKKINDEDIANIVFKELEAIMINNANIKLKIEIGMQKLKILNKEVKMREVEIKVTMKPFYDDINNYVDINNINNNTRKNKTAVHLADLYISFAKSKYLKKTPLNVPSLLNACCQIKISDFDHNQQKDEYKQDVYPPSNIVIPFQKQVQKHAIKQDNATKQKSLKFTKWNEIDIASNTYIQNNKDRLKEFLKLNEAYFKNDKIILDILKDFDNIDSVYQQVYSAFNEFPFFQEHILNNENWTNDNIVKGIRNILYNFMILHIKKFDKTLKNLQLLSFNNNVVQNVIVISYIFNVIINKQSPKDSIKSAFQKYFELNNISEEYIKKNIEELREKKKASLIQLYIQDDEEAKQQQMALKKIGYNDWHNIGYIGENEKYKDEDDKYINPTQDDVMKIDFMVNSNNMDEDKNYIMEYQGENPDEDDDG